MRIITLEDYNTISLDGRPIYRVNMKYATSVHAEIKKLIAEGGAEYALEVLKIMAQTGLKSKLMPLVDRGRKLLCPKCGRKFYDLHRTEVPCPNEECDVVLKLGENTK